MNKKNITILIAFIICLLLLFCGCEQLFYPTQKEVFEISYDGRNKYILGEFSIKTRPFRAVRGYAFTERDRQIFIETITADPAYIGNWSYLCYGGNGGKECYWFRVDDCYFVMRQDRDGYYNFDSHFVQTDLKQDDYYIRIEFTDFLPYENYYVIKEDAIIQTPYSWDMIKEIYRGEVNETERILTVPVQATSMNYRGQVLKNGKGKIAIHYRQKEAGGEYWLEITEIQRTEA